MKFVCKDSRKCVLRKADGACEALEKGYPDGYCPFAKAVRTDVSYHTLELRKERQRA